MAAVDFVEIILEENPINENSVAVPATGPNRLAGEKLYFAGRSAKVSANAKYKDRSDEFRSIPAAVAQLLDHYEPDGSLTSYAYFNHLTWLLSLSGFVGTVTPGGATVGDADTTTATGVNALNSATINVGDTSLFPTAGTIVLIGAAVTYTGKTATSFTGCGNHAATVGGEAIALNVPTGCYKWVFSKKLGFTPQTGQVRINYANEGFCMKGQGYAISQLGVNGDGELTASLQGLVAKRAAVDSSTAPSYDTQAIQPIRRGDLYLSFLANGGAVDDFSWQITNALNPLRSLSLLPPSNYPDAMEFGDAQVVVGGTIPKRVAAAVDIDAVLAATTFAAKARYKSAKVIASTTYPYSMWLSMPSCQYTQGTVDDLKNVRRKGVSDLAFQAAYDETAGYDAQITIVNSVASIATYT